jgi:hypothetical protein
MIEGILPGPNTCLDSLQSTVLDLTPTNPKDVVLYDKAIDQLDLAINLRNYRLEQTEARLPDEFYWLLIIGISILIVLTWFITGSLLYKVIMTSFMTIIYSALLFLVVVLDLPFRGFFALDASAFIFALSQLGQTPSDCPSGECDITRFKQLDEIKNKVPNKIKNKVSSCIKFSKEINLI